MEKFQLPDHILSDLKCGFCNEYLSYAPITLHPDTGSVCGRCPTLESEHNITPLRETNYEKLAKNLLVFPCRYKSLGCDGTYSMDAIPSHEAVCSFKSFFCPILPLGSCAWQGMPVECLMHFLSDHPELAIESNKFEVDLIHQNQINICMSHGDMVFIIHTEFYKEEGMFYCGIYQIMQCEAKKYKYSVEFCSQEQETSFKLPEMNVPAYKDLSKEDGYQVNVTIIRERLHYPSVIICQVYVTEIQDELSNLNTSGLSSASDRLERPGTEDETAKSVQVIEDKMLIDIECPVCQEYMIPPIYQCQTGHSVCGECKPQLRECPACRGSLGQTRNFTLEKITEYMMYRCRNRYDGCLHRSNSKEIRKHEEECKYSPVTCPFHELMDCSWKGLVKEITSHAKISHPDFLISSPLFILASYCNEGNGEQQRIALVFGEVFRIRLAYNNEKRKVYGTVQYVGSSEDAAKYMYVVQVTDLKSKCLQLMSKKYCGSITSKRNDAHHCSIWPIEMITPFLSEDKHIHMKYTIIKV